MKHTATIKCTPINAVIVKIGNSRKLYASKKAARRNVAWRMLYDTGRLNKGDFNTFADSSPKPTWANKRFECQCGFSISTYAGEMDGYDSSGCQLHNRRDGYYKRLHARIMRWLEKGYIAKDSGLREVER